MVNWKNLLVLVFIICNLSLLSQSSKLKRTRGEEEKKWNITPHVGLEGILEFNGKNIKFVVEEITEKKVKYQYYVSYPNDGYPSDWIGLDLKNKKYTAKYMVGKGKIIDIIDREDKKWSIPPYVGLEGSLESSGKNLKFVVEEIDDERVELKYRVLYSNKELSTRAWIGLDLEKKKYTTGRNDEGNIIDITHKEDKKWNMSPYVGLEGILKFDGENIKFVVEEIIERKWKYPYYCSYPNDEYVSDWIGLDLKNKKYTTKCMDEKGIIVDIIMPHDSNGKDNVKNFIRYDPLNFNEDNYSPNIVKLEIEDDRTNGKNRVDDFISYDEDIEQVEEKSSSKKSQYSTKNKETFDIGKIEDVKNKRKILKKFISLLSKVQNLISDDENDDEQKYFTQLNSNKDIVEIEGDVNGEDYVYNCIDFLIQVKNDELQFQEESNFKKTTNLTENSVKEDIVKIDDDENTGENYIENFITYDQAKYDDGQKVEEKSKLKKKKYLKCCGNWTNSNQLQAIKRKPTQTIEISFPNENEPLRSGTKGVLLPNLTSVTSQKIQIPFVVIAKIENKFKFLKNEQQSHFWVSYPKNQNASDEYIAIDCKNLTYSQSRHFGTGTIQFNTNAVVEKKKINYNVKKKSMKILNCENLTDFLNERKFQLNTIVKKQKLNYNFKKEPIQVSNFENLTDSLNEGKIELNTVLEKQKSNKEPIQVLNFENLMDSQNEGKNGLNTVAEKQNSNHNDVKKKPMRLLIDLTDAKEAYYSV